jgi:hypothetical protein
LGYYTVFIPFLFKSTGEVIRETQSELDALTLKMMPTTKVQTSRLDERRKRKLGLPSEPTSLNFDIPECLQYIK